jgi:hypothetical protein
MPEPMPMPVPVIELPVVELPPKLANQSDVDRMDQLDQWLEEMRPHALLDEAFAGSHPDPVRPLPEDKTLDQVVSDFEERQRQVRESRPDVLIERLDRRKIDMDDDDDKDRTIRILLNYIHVSSRICFQALLDDHIRCHDGIDVLLLTPVDIRHKRGKSIHAPRAFIKV